MVKFRYKWDWKGDFKDVFFLLDFKKGLVEIFYMNELSSFCFKVEIIRHNTFFRTITY